MSCVSKKSIEFIGYSMAYVKPDGWTQRRVNGSIHPFLYEVTYYANSQDQIVRSGNFSYF